MKDQIITNKTITIYGYIVEYEEKLICLIQKNHEKKENCLFEIKIVIPNEKWKKKILFNKEIIFKDNGKDSIDIIINSLRDIIEFNLDDLILMKNKLDEKIKKIINNKKLKDLKEKMDETIRNLEFLINNEEFDSLECLINSNEFKESKYPKETIEKIKYYKEKKISLENLFAFHNINVNEDYNNNYNLYCKEYVILNFNE